MHNYNICAINIYNIHICISQYIATHLFRVVELTAKLIYYHIDIGDSYSFKFFRERLITMLCNTKY